MIVSPASSRLALAIASSASLALPLTVDAQSKPLLTPQDYGRFETLGAAALSPDGRWMAYTVSRVDERVELRIRRIDPDTTLDTTRVALWGSSPAFSADGRWLAWSVGVSAEERQRLEREKKPVRTGVALLDLRTGAERSVPLVRSLGFDPSGRFIALHRYPPDEPEGKGADLLVIDLSTGAELTLGNVGELAWHPARPLLAFTIATGAPTGNGVQLYDARTGRLQPLDASGSTYRQLAWRETGVDLAVLRSAAPAAPAGTAGSGAKAGSRHLLLAWRGVDRATPARLELDPRAAGVPDTLEVVAHAPPRWSDDGRRIAFGLRPVDSTAAARDSSGGRDSSARASGDSARRRTPGDELPALQIWHTSDVLIFPQQKTRETQASQRTLLAVWDPAAGRVTQVGSDAAESAALLHGWRYGIERVAAPYAWGTMFGRRYADVWVVDLATGARSRALEKVRYAWESAGGRYLLWFDGTDYWTHDLESGRRTNITTGLATAFADTAYDTPTDLLPPHGVGGWLDGDRAVLLYDRYDVWRVSPDGRSRTRLTSGAGARLVHRVVDLDREREAIDPRRPLYLSLHGEWSEQRGYARIRPGKEPETLLLADRFVTGLMKADSAPVLAWSVEGRDDSPDWFVGGADLAAPRQASATNPFQADFAWTRSELVEFTSETGRPLQAFLLYPANHDPSRRYPMIVYAYEMLSQEVHRYEPPSERDYYNFTAWTQHGYFVLVPDIVFRKRDPGVSLLETLRPAVASVAARGLVDPARVGFVGHSWGGYHATYAATHSDIFAATVAGAPLTDFVSFMGQIHWAQGNAETDHWETGQARMEVPYWEDPEAHHRNSPVHNVNNMKTPILMAFGDADGTVDWDQGTEFYNFARRAGKQMVLLVYEGEGHSFRRKPNQVDYHRRILEWFGHYLQGEPAPAWISKGVRLTELEREKRRVAGKREPIAP
jgi:dipeptidyl aminopeptidase/acylaminoacyl peptidase